MNLIYSWSAPSSSIIYGGGMDLITTIIYGGWFNYDDNLLGVDFITTIIYGGADLITAIIYGGWI